MDHLTYFAYGSNVNRKHLLAYLTTHNVDSAQVTRVRRAFLDGYRLRTNYLTAGLTAAANIEPAEGHVVEGIVMQITPDVRKALRVKEAVPFRYDEIPIKVRLRNGWRLDAFTYRVTPAMQQDTDLPVSDRYRNLILHGAQDWGFSPGYQAHLDTLLKTA